MKPSHAWLRSIMWAELAGGCRWHGERVAKSIGIVEGEAFTRSKRLPVIHKAIVIVESPKHRGIYQPHRTEPSTTDVNVGDTATRQAHVHDLNGVGGDSIGKRRRGTLEYHDVVLCACRAYSITIAVLYMCMHIYQVSKVKANMMVLINLRQGGYTIPVDCSSFRATADVLFFLEKTIFLMLPWLTVSSPWIDSSTAFIHF